MPKLTSIVCTSISPCAILIHIDLLLNIRNLQLVNVKLSEFYFDALHSLRVRSDSLNWILLCCYEAPNLRHLEITLTTSVTDFQELLQPYIQSSQLEELHVFYHSPHVQLRIERPLRRAEFVGIHVNFKNTSELEWLRFSGQGCCIFEAQPLALHTYQTAGEYSNSFPDAPNLTSLEYTVTSSYPPPSVTKYPLLEYLNICLFVPLVPFSFHPSLKCIQCKVHVRQICLEHFPVLESVTLDFSKRGKLDFTLRDTPNLAHLHIYSSNYVRIHADLPQKRKLAVWHLPNVWHAHISKVIETSFTQCSVCTQTLRERMEQLSLEMDTQAVFLQNTQIYILMNRICVQFQRIPQMDTTGSREISRTLLQDVYNYVTMISRAHDHSRSSIQEFQKQFNTLMDVLNSTVVDHERRLSESRRMVRLHKRLTYAQLDEQKEAISQIVQRQNNDLRQLKKDVMGLTKHVHNLAKTRARCERYMCDAEERLCFVEQHQWKNCGVKNPFPRVRSLLSPNPSYI